MSGSAAFSGRTDTWLAQQAAQGFAAEREAFLFGEFFAQMVIIEAGIGGAGQAVRMRSRTRCGQAAMAGPSAAGVCQSRLTALP